MAFAFKVRWPGDFILLGSVWGHLVCGTVGQPSHKLLAFVAPRNAAHTSLEDRAVGTRDRIAGLEVSNKQVAINGDQCDKCGSSIRVRHESAERHTIRGDLQRGLRITLGE